MKISTTNPGIVTVSSLRQADNTALKLTHPVVDLDLCMLYASDEINGALAEIQTLVDAGSLTIKDASGVVIASVDDGIVLPGGLNPPKQKHVFSYSARWYSRLNNYYGPSNYYGPGYPVWYVSYGSNPLAVNYTVLGFVAPWDCIIKSTELQFRRQDATALYTASLIRQEKSPGSSSVVNTQIGSPLALGAGPTNIWNKEDFDVSVGNVLNKGDHIVPLLTCNVNSTRYLYCNISMEIERR